ncbi:MAG: spermidine synthase [Phenylobacterium sp.]|uniref:spermidine synthase n=1 Tax=Phenylobacterium sp. TaxID=1871053 RepID=UPI002600EE4C|nr:spermidine synthase [Phenylobacterium sp.]MCG9916061.1 spermidine synthase [Phenylobacterium sp.]
MKPWIHLDSAQMPDGGGELRLMRRDTEFSIMAGAIELMNSRLSGSEEALATLAWDRLAGRAAPRVLIGGLGMGFTLRAALAVLPADARVTVAELVPEVIAWARGPLAEVFKGCLDDPRVSLHTGDVGPLIAQTPAAWDAILLDVDNGPEGLTRRANDALYDLTGLARARTSLTPGGVLAVWSSAPDEGFTRRLRRSGLTTEVVRVPARKGGRGARHVIWLGVRG